MSIFGSIMSKIFGHGSAQAANASPSPAPSGSPASTATPASAPAQTVDVAAIVDKAAAAKGEKLAWRTSIVDLMKALDLDSSLAARKEEAVAEAGGHVGRDAGVQVEAGLRQHHAHVEGRHVTLGDGRGLRLGLQPDSGDAAWGTLAPE